MAIIQMQKVAVLAHKSEQESLLTLLQEEGVLEISEARESSSAVDHTEVNFRAAELEYAIATLKNVADKKTLALAKKWEKGGTVEQVLHAANSTDVLGIVEALHNLENADERLEMEMSGKRAAASFSGGAEQPVFLASAPKQDLSKVGGDAGAVQMSAEEQTKRAQAEQELQKNQARRTALANELPNLILLRRYLQWLGQKQAAREAMHKTKSTVMLSGWLPKNRILHVEKVLAKKIPTAALLSVAPSAGEVAPVELKNSPILTPFESVTKLYGLPQYHEMDPTPFLALFFILFFALCLTDAGYGFVQAAVMGIVLLKTRKTVREAPLFWLLFVSGIVTVIVSIPFGGWFGMTADKAPAFMTLDTNGDGVRDWFKGQVWNLGDQQGITFLQNLSLALGVIHLSFGMLLAAYWKIRHGEFSAAFWLDLSPFAMTASLVVWFLAPVEYKQIALYAVYASILYMIWGKGHGSPLLTRPLFGLLQTANFFLGMMGNVLSYLRILALGLVTGALAFTVNLVAEQISALLPWFIAIPFVIVVYVVGHFANIVLNVLGAFIHSGRLQFVEFFSQFFEGGGRPFRPFSRS